MSLALSRTVLVVVVAWLWFFPRVALAEVELSLSLGAREVAVGEAVQVRLDAMSDDGEEPSQPELTVPTGFEVRGPSVGTRQQVSINGFSMVTQKGISASWLVTPIRAGLFTVGPATVVVKGQTKRSETVQLQVLPPGQQPRARSRRRSADPFDNFDPFGNGAFDDLFDRLQRGGGSRFEQLPEAPTDLVPPRPLDSLAFLDAHIDTRRAVVGQQVTLSIYAHGAQGLFQEAPGAREPSTPDFLAQRLVEDGSRQPVYQYNLDGQRWIAVKVRELALFPLRAGKLEIGPLEFGFLGRRYGVRNGEGLRRSTRPIVIDVTEPPSDGRPPGYSGEVGNFALSASVEPRKIAAGGSVAVTARVKGRGRLPGALALPEQSGVEWLEPTIRDDALVDDSVVGGTRTFSYVVRLTKSGTLDLGALKLPLFNPATGRYRVESFALGNINVEPAPEAAAGATAEHDEGPHLSSLVSFRSSLGPHESQAFLADRAGFWWMLGAGPGLVLAGAGALLVLGRVRGAARTREQSQATHATRAIGDAREALAEEKVPPVASAAERALYNAVEWATGVKARAVLRSDLGRDLTRAGLPEALASRVGELLDACGQLRFGGSDPARARVVVDDVEQVVKLLVRRPPAKVASGEERHP